MEQELASTETFEVMVVLTPTKLKRTPCKQMATLDVNLSPRAVPSVDTRPAVVLE
jgi:hypothetical protein